MAPRLSWFPRGRVPMTASSQLAILEAVQRILVGLSERRFYGSVELRFEAGRVVLLRKTETLKPDDYRDTRGDDDGQAR